MRSTFGLLFLLFISVATVTTVAADSQLQKSQPKHHAVRRKQVKGSSVRSSSSGRSHREHGRQLPKGGGGSSGGSSGGGSSGGGGSGGSGGSSGGDGADGASTPLGGLMENIRTALSTRLGKTMVALGTVVVVASIWALMAALGLFASGTALGGCADFLWYGGTREAAAAPISTPYQLDTAEAA